jgi:hypothetical protein
MPDPLAEFRRTPETAPPGDGKAPLRPAYRAFAVGARGTVPRLDLRARELAHAVSTSALVDITYDLSDDTGFILLFSTGLQAKVDGRNLRLVIDALKSNTCEFLEEHDRERFDAPADDAPVIERITLRTPRAETKD